MNYGARRSPPVVRLTETSMQAAQAQELDTLSNLEERITRAVQAITTLRGDNHQFQERLKATEAELASTRAARDEAQGMSSEFQNENAELEANLKHANEELEALRTERRQVKDRIEKLLGQLDLLSGS